MKFISFKEFKPVSNSVNYIFNYLSEDLRKMIAELNLGLNKLSLVDNFESFIETVTIAAGAEISIRNKLQGATPTKKIVLRGKDGAQNIVDGDTDWDINYVYLKNVGGSAATATVLFMR